MKMSHVGTIQLSTRFVQRSLVFVFVSFLSVALM